MFCSNCGNAADENTRFCASCGAALRRENPIPPPAPAVPVSGQPAAPRKPLKDRIMDWLLIPVAIILLLMGFGYMILSVAGRATTAQVIGNEQIYIVNNDDSTRDSRRYKPEYEFAAGGKHYTGSVTRIFGGGSRTRSTVAVRYLPFRPHVNAEDGGAAGLVGSVMPGAGIVALVLGIRGKFRLRNKNRL